MGDLIYYWSERTPPDPYEGNLHIETHYRDDGSLVVGRDLAGTTLPPSEVIRLRDALTEHINKYVSA